MSHKPDPNKNVTLTIDGITVTVPEGTRILEAAKQANVQIPTLCEHPDLCKRALCRICVVEADGRGKLIAACANDVWEGVSIVTNNKRLLEIRKTILELILANHPQDCLFCVRNKNCELQTLAEQFGIRNGDGETPPFDRSEIARKQAACKIDRCSSAEKEIIIFDRNKCVKCGRCVEACQEEQTIRAINTSCRSHEFNVSAPFEQTLESSGCVFCGRCAEVCPVGAIYEKDQTSQVSACINSGRAEGRQTIAQVYPELTAAMDHEFGITNGFDTSRTVTTGKLVAAIKLLGFNKVFDASVAADITNSELENELERRLQNSGNLQSNLPMITGSSESVALFVKNFYPDLAGHLAEGKNPRRVFADTIKKSYAAAEGLDASNITTVSFVYGINQKYGSGGNDFALTAKELARMIKAAGIMIETLPEEPFDTIDVLNQNSAAVSETQEEIVYGFAEARKALEAVRNGEFALKCGAHNWIEIHL